MKSRVFVAAAVAALVCAPGLTAPPMPRATADPWAKVPALPTACYSRQDKWWEQINAAINAVNEDEQRQAAINAGIEKKLNDATRQNPMAMAQAMQQAMMKDPQNAQKYMAQAMQKGQQANTEVPAQLDKEKELQAESKPLMQQYKAVLDKARAPAAAREAALAKKLKAMGIELDVGEQDYPPWAIQEGNAIARDWDQAYVATCATWWSATGPIHAYMKRYKDYLVQERIPYQKRLIDEPALDNYKMLNVPTAGWRTTTDYTAAAEYMKMASGLFDKRDGDPGEFR